jgi:hypothetical protein
LGSTNTSSASLQVSTLATTRPSSVETAIKVGGLQKTTSTRCASRSIAIGKFDPAQCIGKDRFASDARSETSLSRASGTLTKTLDPVSSI